MSEYRLLHFSDMHIAKDANRLPSPLESGTFRKRLARIRKRWPSTKPTLDQLKTNWVKPSSHSTRALRAFEAELTRVAEMVRPHAFVVSGDLAATGEELDIRCAASVFSDASSAGEPRLEMRPSETLLIPGNHDRFSGCLLRPKSAWFERCFNEFRVRRSDCGKIVELPLSDDGCSPLVILGCDFSLRKARDAFDSVPIAPEWIGRGKVYSDTLSGLVRRTGEIRNEWIESVVVWVVHFPPHFPGISNSLVLLGQQDLAKAAVDAGVQLMLSGHTHQRQVYTQHGLAVSCAGSVTDADLDANWNFSVLRIQTANGRIARAGSIDYHYDSGSECFRAKDKLLRII